MQADSLKLMGLSVNLRMGPYLRYMCFCKLRVDLYFTGGPVNQSRPATYETLRVNASGHVFLPVYVQFETDISG